LSFDQFIGGMIGASQDRGKAVPVCLMSQYPDLQERFAFFDKHTRDTRTKIKEIEEQFDLAKKEFWATIEKDLINKDLLTQKEVDQNINLRIKDEVLFKYVEEEEKKNG